MSQEPSLLLELRPVSEEIRARAYHWRNHPSIYRWCRQYEPVSEAHHHKYWERVDEDPSVRMYAVLVYGTAVGICGLTSIDWINRRAEFSLYIAPEYQSEGYLPPALHALLSHGFNVLNLNSIWGEVFEDNPALEVFKSLGFIEEGRRRSFYYREGKYIDAVLISILKTEFSNA